ncbi:hypothetical protein AAG906_022343 [Vitis piasezkii]
MVLEGNCSGGDTRSCSICLAKWAVAPVTSNDGVSDCAIACRLLRRCMPDYEEEADISSPNNATLPPTNNVPPPITLTLPSDVTATYLLIRASSEEATIYDGNIVQNLVEGFVIHDRSAPGENEFQEISSLGCVSKTLKLMVVKLVDGYLAEMVTGFSRPSHDGLYHAIDMYMKEHPGISMSERKRIRRLMDCKRLSTDTCMHAVGAAASSAGSSTFDLPGSVRALLPSGSHGSSSLLPISASSTLGGSTLKDGNGGDPAIRIDLGTTCSCVGSKEDGANNDASGELKKLDSFGKWMDKEIGGDCDDSLMASASGNYWNTLDTQNDNKEIGLILKMKQRFQS